jgi:cell division initiation protein
MAITAHDILEREFRTRIRGYDTAQVDAFLEEIAETLTAVMKENNALKDRLAACGSLLEETRKKSQDFQEALTAAHRLADEMRIQATNQAKNIIERARVDAERIVADAHQESVRLEERIYALRRFHREAVFKVRSTIEEYLRILDDETLPSDSWDNILKSTASEARAIQQGPPRQIEEPITRDLGEEAEPDNVSPPEEGPEPESAENADISDTGTHVTENGPVLDFNPDELYPKG